MSTRTGSVMRHTITVSVCTGVSRLLGLAREIAMAAFFGTSLAQSAFVVAFRLPNLFRRLFGEGALSAAFIPVFSESVTREGPERAWQLAGRVMTLLGVVLCAIGVGGIAAISVALKTIVLSEKAALVLSLLRIMLPYVVFICLMGLCMAALNSFHHFLVPAASPILLNMVWLASLWWLCPRFGETRELRIYGVAWGVLLAGVLQLAVQIPMLVRYGFRGNLSFNWRDPRVRRVLVLMGPAAIGVGVTQINVVIDSLLAMWIGDWAPAALFYAERLIYLPLGLFATALGTVLLPTFSRQAARVDHAEIKRTLNRSLRGLLLVMAPAAAGLLALAPAVVELTFQRGAFDAWSTVLTTRAVCFYAPGLVAFSLYKALVPAFYALQDTTTPVRIGVRVVGLNLLLNIAFLLTWPLYYKHAGLALATVIAAVVNAVALGWSLHRRLGSPGWREIARSALVIGVCAGIMGLAVKGVHRALLEQAGDVGALVAAVAAGALLYGGLTAAACGRERRELLDMWRRRKKAGHDT